jgi:hypothetical protein
MRKIVYSAPEYPKRENKFVWLIVAYFYKRALHHHFIEIMVSYCRLCSKMTPFADQLNYD